MAAFSRDAVDGVLRRDVGGVPGEAREPRDGGHVDDRPAPPLRQHLAEFVAHREEHALHVGAEDVVPVGLRRLVDRREDEVLLRGVVDRARRRRRRPSRRRC